MFTVWEVLAIVALVSIMVSGNGLLVGWLVYRAKREPHEYLSPPSIRKSDTLGAINVDDLARQEDLQDPGLPDSIKAASSQLDHLFRVAEASERTKRDDEKEKADA